METAVQTAADAIATQGAHGLTTTVSGRDVTVSGVSEVAELDDLTALFDAIEGRRLVDLNGVTVLPVVSPFEMQGALDGETATVTGVIPHEGLREDLRAIVGDASADNLDLADGEPDAEWGAAALASYAALDTLKSGQFRLSDQTIDITGLSANPTELAKFEDALTAIPDGYTVATDIDVEDDGTPMRLDLAFDGETLRGSGKVPVDLAADTIALEGVARDVDIAQGRIPADHESWTMLAQNGVAVLGTLGNGTLSMEGRSVAISGEGVPKDIESADTMIADMRTAAPDFDIVSDVQLYDDGKPFSLSATFDGTTLQASGKVPADFGGGLDENLIATQTISTISTAYILDDNGTWPAIAHAGLNALATLEEGTLDITGDTITLNGTALSPDAFETTKAALGNFGSTGDVTFIDDGAPVAMVLSYASGDATVSGKLPSDLTPADIAQTLGFAVEDDGTTQSITTNDTGLLVPLVAVKETLPEIDSLTFSNGEAGAQLDAIAAPGVDAEQLGAILSETLGGTADVTVAAAADLPTNGTTRTNRFTGRDEVFTSGHWLPTFDFRSTIEACTEQTNVILAERNVQFLSGSAQLDVPSIRAVNGLAALARKCALEAGLFLTISGHTDNTGNADANLTLSQARADAVRDAILARGVAQAAVTALGFGDTQPIADNDTEDGKAANRRTEFSWVFE
jgi:OOP family OmpA-OmpF porin